MNAIIGIKKGLSSWIDPFLVGNFYLILLSLQRILFTAIPFIKPNKRVDLIDHGLNGKNIVTRHKINDEPNEV